jgi:hypothetical protein
MKCPHCTVSFHDFWTKSVVVVSGSQPNRRIETTVCPTCEEITALYYDANEEEFMVEPLGSNRGPVPPEVPSAIAVDYVEACNVLPISAKASAALSRRCLQAVLRSQGYKAPDLAKEVDLILAETDASKAIPQSLRTVIDGIRNFGNFSAHPITDVTGLQIIDVEPEEAEWCLEVLEECFDHFYVRPVQAAARKAALDAKLAQAGKPPSKG